MGAANRQTSLADLAEHQNSRLGSNSPLDVKKLRFLWTHQKLHCFVTLVGFFFAGFHLVALSTSNGAPWGKTHL